MTRTPPRVVDWDALKRRLAIVEQALSPHATLNSVQSSAVLEARARAVAARAPHRPSPSAALDVVEFVLAGHRLAIDASHVREVRPLDALTRVPCTPAFVSGIIHAHGRILAVLDLKTFLGLAGSALSDLNKVIILEHGDTQFGILADRIVGTARVPLSQVQPARPPMQAARASCVRGTTDDGLIMLDAARLIASPALAIDSESAP